MELIVVVTVAIIGQHRWGRQDYRTRNRGQLQESAPVRIESFHISPQTNFD
jgi:hypothetical protein